MRVSVTREHGWPMGHRLQHHEGRCRYPHGHNYLARVTVQASSWPPPRGEGPEGMVVDFAVLDQAIRAVTDPWDHSFMCERSDPLAVALAEFAGERLVLVDGPPTAEHIAHWLFALVQEALPYGVVTEVQVFEGPRAAATVRR